MGRCGVGTALDGGQRAGSGPPAEGGKAAGGRRGWGAVKVVGAGGHRTALWAGAAAQWGPGKGRRGLQCVLVKLYRPLCGEKPCFVAFATFCALSTPAVASFKLPALKVGQEGW